MALFSPLCLIGGESGKQLFWSIEETFFGWVLGHVACWSYTAKYKVIESGDSLGNKLFMKYKLILIRFIWLNKFFNVVNIETLFSR